MLHGSSYSYYSPVNPWISPALRCILYVGGYLPLRIPKSSPQFFAVRNSDDDSHLKKKELPCTFLMPGFFMFPWFSPWILWLPTFGPPKVATSLRTGRRGCSVWCDWLRAREPSPRWPREAGQPGELVSDEWNIPEVMFFRWVIFTIYPGIWVNI